VYCHDRTVVSGSKSSGGEGERLEGLVAEDGKGPHMVDVRASLRAGIIGGEALSNV
jgi:hypothetical protein